ncbi:sialate O-acetylesterase [Flavobacterium selenitireducens]|uniref:sialate O-acetylesterase n=1 Tax=Flavobacterium selenitireducens TaxID=2722704 RepID=UPI00168B0E68|nr:sialate O-acetylesterase [Flavobacterium selenitireducens]MBD3581470.1 sialate O-acetylesterase [Flavobacterium selenitireducens]
MLNYRLSRFFICSFALFAGMHSSAAQVKKQKPSAKGDTFRMFYLGGQSNMEGFGYVKDLPAELSGPMQDVYIFDGNRGGDGQSGLGVGKWEQLRPGHGTDFSTDGKQNKLSARFGPEMTFAERMRELYPGEKIAIVKYARNGSGIDSLATGPFGCWEPEYRGKPNQWDFFLKTVKGAQAIQDINGDGRPDTLVPSGILWMQGEADACFTEEIAYEYHKNLAHLIGKMREVFGNNDLPVVIGKISDSGQNETGILMKYGDVVRAMQERFVSGDSNSAIVRNTSKYGYSDAWHYDSAGYMDFGIQFANEMAKLLKRK